MIWENCLLTFFTFKLSVTVSQWPSNAPAALSGRTSMLLIWSEYTLPLWYFQWWSMLFSSYFWICPLNDHNITFKSLQFLLRMHKLPLHKQVILIPFVTQPLFMALLMYIRGKLV
jgi:hypothetical protein